MDWRRIREPASYRVYVFTVETAADSTREGNIDRVSSCRGVQVSNYQFLLSYFLA